jgi:hypothetical protein
VRRKGLGGVCQYVMPDTLADPAGPRQRNYGFESGAEPLMFGCGPPMILLTGESRRPGLKTEACPYA